MRYYCEDVFNCCREYNIVFKCNYGDRGELYCFGKYRKINMTEFEYKMRLKIKESK